MATRITMPSWGQTTDESLIAKWRKQVGDTVKRGEELFDIESDKAAQSVESFAEGTLLAILHGEGETVSSGEVVAIIGVPGESITVPSDAAPVSAGHIPETVVIRQSPVREASDGGLLSPKARRAAREQELAGRSEGGAEVGADG